MAYVHLSIQQLSTYFSLNFMDIIFVTNNAPYTSPEILVDEMRSEVNCGASPKLAKMAVLQLVDFK